ncbi:MAG: hypothetical protein A2Z99_03265 [Treponema sp. GWB1_62_6]|nr:MAG: hypothetical protein A2Z99_03265 [Treponema sp. GWB1_62_6]
MAAVIRRLAMTDKKLGDASGLRALAESKFREREGSADFDDGRLEPDEVKRTLHELRVHQIELEMQNEELRRTHSELDGARARWFDLYDLAPVGFVELDGQGTVTEANLAAAIMLGLGRGSMVARPFSCFVLPEDKDILYLYRKKFSDPGSPSDCELRMVKPDGTILRVRMTTSISRNSDGSISWRVALSDITERKNAEEGLRKALDENRNLLLELQHRTKNSLNLIHSMIDLSSMAASTPEVKDSLDELGARVRAVSELYGLLQSVTSYKTLQLDEYCIRIAEPIVGLSWMISLAVEAESIEMPVKNAATIGLIVTELMMNAMKYAFPDERHGVITLAIRKTAVGALLEIRDDGIGLPDGFALPDDAGLGLNLVRELIGQIGGSFMMEGTGTGTRCTVEFPIADHGMA